LKETAHVADSQRPLSKRPAVANKRSRQIAKGGGFRIHSGQKASIFHVRLRVPRETVTSLFYGASYCRNGGSVMRDRVDIDHIIRRAIIREIGEALRASVREEQELPASLGTQINRLRQWEGQSPSPTDPGQTTPWWRRHPKERG
jgi:hypothetical protein